MKHYRHKDKPDVICEMIGNTLRFGRWAWSNGICSEVYKFKEVTEDFTNVFEEITQAQFNNEWGVKLQNA